MQVAACGEKRPSDPVAWGRSRSRLTSKIHTLVDAMGLPIALKLKRGQAHDPRSAEDMFDTVRAGLKMG